MKCRTFSITIETNEGIQCIKFYDGKKTYTGKVAHKKYMKQQQNIALGSYY